jgi:hypothetical protein
VAGWSLAVRAEAFDDTAYAIAAADRAGADGPWIARAKAWRFQPGVLTQSPCVDCPFRGIGGRFGPVARWALRWETITGPVTRDIPDHRVLVLGRDPTCDVAFDDGTVSRRHCELFVRDGRAWLRHLSTRNPTYVNGRIALGEMPLAGGDILAIPVLAIEVVALGD